MMLQFVTAEEAAKWPEGTRFVAGRVFKDDIYEPSVGYYVGMALGLDSLSAFQGFTHFARLPDTLPELEGK